MSVLRTTLWAAAMLGAMFMLGACASAPRRSLSLGEACQRLDFHACYELRHTYEFDDLQHELGFLRGMCDWGVVEACFEVTMLEPKLFDDMVAQAQLEPHEVELPIAFTPAMLIYGPMPNQPELWKARPRDYQYHHHSYTTELRMNVCVGPDGHVSSVRTLRRIYRGYALEALLRRNIERWRFRPATFDGQPHLSCMEFRFRVRIEKRED